MVLVSLSPLSRSESFTIAGNTGVLTLTTENLAGLHRTLMELMVKDKVGKSTLSLTPGYRCNLCVD